MGLWRQYLPHQPGIYANRSGVGKVVCRGDLVRCQGVDHQTEVAARRSAGDAHPAHGGCTDQATGISRQDVYDCHHIHGSESMPARWIAAVYQSRWLIELDIRSIKCSLDMDILRAKTPAMVLTELWSCLLAYNLIRLKMLQSSLSTGRDPRSLSFTTTQQMLATNWLLACTLFVTGTM
tara:strand:- start:2878 stop:3414 length:537 start_codon:yes stop_codon:yes gene_type:complete